MKKFAFSLEPVLDHRKRIEDELATAVEDRRREFDESQSRLLELNVESRRRADVLRECGRLAAEELRLHYAHLEYLARAIAAQRRVVEERAAALQNARAALVEGRKQRKVLDALKTRSFDTYAAENRRIERNELDEQNARRHSRGQSEVRIAE